MTTTSLETTNRSWRYALWLAIFTILYNLAEGLASIDIHLAGGVIIIHPPPST